MKILFLFLYSCLAQEVYFKSLKGKLLAEPKPKSNVISELKRGDKLSLVSKKAGWLSVEYDGKSGWVAKILTSKKPPGKKVSLLNKKVDLSKKARKRASNFSSSAAARGLMPSKEEIEYKMQSANKKALKKMKEFQISEAKALKWFLKE
jgi:uncharacterized protein YgiM (DUF1202 family)